MSPTFATSMFNKRFALVGLSSEEANAVTDALTEAHATAETISADVARTGINTLAAYHACIVDASAIDGDGSLGGIALAEIAHRQVLAIVEEAQVGESDLAAAHLDWEIIVRPLRGTELLMRLSRLMCRAGEAIGFVGDRNRRRVLVVDDDETVRALLSAVLESAGFECDCVPNASEALAALAGGHHDLVMLDLGMPEIDGFKVLKALRTVNRAHSPAVIIVTSATGEEDIIRGFGMGADDYITKPFNPRELVARCRRAIRGGVPFRPTPADASVQRRPI